MKIGILAFQQAINYGASLQIYALQETVKSLTPKNTEIYVINYQNQHLTKEYQVFQIYNNLLKDSLRSMVYAPFKLTKKKQFSNFYKENMILTRKMNSLQQLEDFDVLIVGSDQVWNPDITGHDDAYALKVPFETRKISYAASLGKTHLSAKDKAYFKSFLPEFSAVSMREKEAKDLLSAYVPQEITVTLDPTLLLSKNKWQEIAHKPIKEEKYILVYALEENDALKKITEKVAHLLALPVKYVMPTGSFKERTSLKYASGPAEFLSLIENSEYIITNSFHGTCFAVIYEKAFITVPHQSRGGRMVNFLEDLELEHHIVYQADDFDLDKHLPQAQNFTQAKILLSELKKDSINFLKTNIKLADCKK